MEREAFVLFWLIGLMGFCACSKKEVPLASIPLSDDFSRDTLGQHWKSDWGWMIKDGQVFTTGTKNEQPLWLQAALPDDAVFEFDTRSENPDGDIKFEAYGDGKHHASGYIFIFGGWKNTISCIARLDEHGKDRQELKVSGLVKPGQTYRMKVLKKGKTLRWTIDGKLFLDFYDAQPLSGPNHNRFAFGSYASELYFDNLSIRKATEADE